MAENTPPKGAGTDLDNGESDGSITLEQALLAPLDSILKAQLHSARSFLNMLLQLGYPHNPKDDKDASGKDDTQEKDKTPSEPYHLEFAFADSEGNKQLVKVPALSLVPISPLAVDSASFDLEMAANKVTTGRRQIRESENLSTDESSEDYNAVKRPWFLVEKPVEIRGDIIAPTSTDADSKKQTQSSIKINIQVKSVPMPAGLSKLLTALSSMNDVKEIDDRSEESNN